MVLHVRYNSLYISLPSSAKQQREMTKFCVVYRTWTTTANSWYFHLELNDISDGPSSSGTVELLLFAFFHGNNSNFWLIKCNLHQIYKNVCNLTSDTLGANNYFP